MLTKIPTPETMMIKLVITISTARTFPTMSLINRFMGMIGLTAWTLCPRDLAGEDRGGRVCSSC